VVLRHNRNDSGRKFTIIRIIASNSAVRRKRAIPKRVTP
jgi:hypothetical protein